ncbi:MAG: desulfoferrodoxin [Candidatus Gastranaerophilales bacterium]|nr:desulfoferrodoxin [Candidatus Gastranaerophilales bacterium]
MTELMQIYKCNICGNIVEVIHPGAGDLVCCGEKMELLTEQTNDDGVAEKHKPVITFDGETKTIRVGSIPHPMEENHYIMFVEAISPDKKYIKRKYLSPNDEPKLDLKCKCEKIIARELCNVHGLWRAEN